MDLKHVSIVLLLYVTMATSQQQCDSPTNRCDCYIDDAGLRIINCRYRNLTQVPAFTSNGQSYDRINFISTEATGQCMQPDCNDITSLPANVFANLNVKVIDLRNNAIRSFDQNAFRGLENILNGLLIEGDGNISPPYTSLARLQNLRSLHLENFQQTDMTTTNTNLNFPELLTLTLNKLQGVSLLHENVFIDIPKVTELNIQRMHSLTDLPVSAIFKLQRLTLINIFDTRISRIYGQSFEQLNNLISIHLDSNEKLVTIDSNAFDGVEDTLEFLYMSQNALTSSVLGIFPTTNWPALTQLHLGYNYFATIPAGAFRTMPNLVYLELQDVALSSISNDMFNGLSKLHTLDLAYNQITGIATETFRNNPELTELRINEQQTNGQKMLFAANAFQGVETSLERLFIEKNKLEASQLWQIIRSFTNILELNLADLALTEIPDRAFQNNVKLSNLVLSENNITTLNQQTFYGPRSTLKTINMNYNQIQTISECVFSDFTTQPSIRLIGNALTCDCRVAWLYDWVKLQPDEDTAAFSYIGSCSSPDSLKGKFFNMFDRSQLTCPPGYVEPVCTDLYTTTTTAAPKPVYTLIVGQKTSTSISLTWTIDDKTRVTRYQMVKFYNNVQLEEKYINKDASQFTFPDLTPGNTYRFCLFLELDNVLDNTQTDTNCKTATPPPKPSYDLIVGQKTSTSISLTWSIPDKTQVTAYQMVKFSNGPVEERNVHRDESQYTFNDLSPGNTYRFCLFLFLDNVLDDMQNERNCKSATPADPGTTTPLPTTPEPEAQTSIGIIIGACVGGVILIVLLIIIVCLLMVSSKKKKMRAAMTEGVKFTSHAGMPQAGGTAKRFAKKPDKEGASPDDINVTVISSGDMSKERHSGGSYQFLNEKDPRRVSKNPNGHYANDIDMRPLPRAPGGARGQGTPSGLGAHGYVNESFKNSDSHLPETSTNTYSEVKY